jgi:methylglutaconyl-CoA hydratase
METLRAERAGAVLRVTLARPEKRNAFDATLIEELTETFENVGDARAVVLAADGPAFSAGADLEWMRSSVALSYEQNVADALTARRMLRAIDECAAPVVCRIHGAALGGAAGLVACSDVALASEDAFFGFSEVRLGIVPAVISPFVLARIGPGPARRYFLTGERFGAHEARRIGLVHEVAADVDAAVERTLAGILSGGPEAVRAAKRLVLDEPLGDETATRLAEQRTSAEGQEGLSAFLEGREPAWRA